MSTKRPDDQPDGSEASQPPEAAESPAAPRARVTKRVAAHAATVAHAVAGAADAVVDAADEVVDAIKPAGHRASATVDAAVERARRIPHPTRRPPRPLPNLYAVHPEARHAPVRELGLASIPVDEIVGTAVEGVAQRGLDFQPLPAFRSKNWEARWQRILRAVQQLRSLPPIDVLRTADGYWVTDGHNRVAAALETGQVEVDADVRAVLLPGEPVPRPSASLAPVLAESAQVEAAGRGRLTRGTTIGRPVPDHDHGHDRPAPPADGDDAGPSS
jgi:hypothetical protein